MKKRIRIGALVLAVLVAAMAGSVWAEDLIDGETGGFTQPDDPKVKEKSINIIKEIIAFNANGTGLMNDGGQTQNNGFSWTISGNTITVVTTHHGVQMEFTINSMTSTECSFSGAAMELDGHMMENVVIHMVKVGDEPTPDPDPDPQPGHVDRDLLLGTWQINSMLNNGQDMTEMASQLHIKIHLEEDGSGVISIAFQEYPFTWTLEGDVLNINTGNETINATITSQTADQVVFTSNNMSFPGIGTLPGEANITLVRYNGDDPDPDPDPNPDPVPGELTGTSWGYNYSGTLTEQGMTFEYNINMLLAFTTSTTGTLDESITYTFMGQTDTESENINFTYDYNVTSHTGTMTATVTDPESGDTETQTLPFTYNPSTNTITVTNPNPDSDEGIIPQTIVFYRISK